MTWTEPPPRLVRDGWDQASRIYRPDEAAADVFGHGVGDHRAWLRPLFEELKEGARILDLGCGCGVPDCALLAGRFRVTGVDLSEVQIERARRSVPAATFVRADMTEVAFRAESFDAVLCLYSLIHVPLPAQRPLLGRIRSWLKPRGWLVIITGHTAFEGVEDDWLGSGAPMYWSHADAPTYRRWLEEVGFEIRDQTLIPEGEVGHELFRATARGPPGVGPPTSGPRNVSAGT